jgi:outer membrane protein assembly factor BamB
VRGARSSSAAAVLAALALAAGCGGGADAEPAASDTAPAVTQAAPATVTVTNGDTGEPLAGVNVRARVPGSEAAAATTGADGSAQLPGEADLVTAAKPGWGSASGPVRAGNVELRLFDPALQNPEYGGGNERARYLPQVRVPVPSGKAAWTFDAITLIEFPPAVVDGVVLFGVNSGRVFALDAETGRIRWEDRVGGPIASSPAIVGDTGYVTSMDGFLTAYDIATGRRRWQFSTGGSPIESSPLVHDGRVYFGAWNGTVYAVDAARPRLVWSHGMSDQVKGSAARAGERILIADYSGRVSALDAASGAELWAYTGGQRFYGGPGVSGNRMVIGDVGGAVIALDVRDGREVWRHATGDWVYGSPAIADGRVFIGSYDGQFQALRLEDGGLVWSHDAGGRISGSATVVDGTVYTSILYRPGQPRKTWGLDVSNGAVRWQISDGRYSPVVGAGATLYVVGTNLLRAYRPGP